MTDTDPSSTPTAWRIAMWLGAVFVIVQPFLFWTSYAGDAQIHLIYAENAARGAFYQFNVGEISSGVTSSGYMLWLALWFRFFPPDIVPVAAKLSGMLAYWAAAAMLFGLARDLLRSTPWAAAVSIVFGGMPGSAFNSSVGMETSFFLAVFVGWLWWASRASWLSGDRIPYASELGLGLLLGLGFWLRPEAGVIGVCAFGYRAGAALRRGSVGRVAPGLLLSGFAALAVAVAMLAFHHTWTGQWLPTSGRARMFIAQIVSPNLGPFLFDSAFPIRLAAYAPVSVLFFAALPSVWRREDVLGLGGVGRLSSLVFAAGFVMYTFVTGAHHLARYITFLMPGFALIAGAFAQHLYVNWHDLVPRFALARRSLFFSALAFGVTGLYLAESGERFSRTIVTHQEAIGGVTGLEGARRAPALRKQRSDEWIELLGNPKERPIVVAMQEVQLRYEVDERFMIRSLDGRVDSVLFDFVSPTNVNHVGYFRERDVRFLFDAPHYVNDPTKFSLVQLRGLEPGQRLAHDGLIFTRLTSTRVWRVDEQSSVDRARTPGAERRAQRSLRRLGAPGPDAR